MTAPRALAMFTVKVIDTQAPVPVASLPTVTGTAPSTLSVADALVVIDRTAPVPDANALPDVTGECSANLPKPPTATDACDGRIVGVPDKTGPFGQVDDTITWTFIDSKGNSSTQTQAVHVR